MVKAMVNKALKALDNPSNSLSSSRSTFFDGYCIAALARHIACMRYYFSDWK